MGGRHGPLDSSLASRSSDSDHHSSRHILALRENRMSLETSAVTHISGAESSRSAVAWSAIIAGAFVAAAASILLLVLGSALGLAAVSPWAGSGVTAASLGVGAAIWLIVTQWIASGVGGYIAGRLRTKWVGVHDHEVFFRDTAHGFVTWSVATVLTAALLASSLASILGAGTQAVSSVASGAMQGAGSASSQLLDPTAYYVDRMFRNASSGSAAATAPATPGDGATTPPANGAVTSPSPMNGNGSVRLEGARIFARNLASGQMDAGDRTYLAQLVSQTTGVPQADAEKRVDNAMTEAQAAATKVKQTADEARKGAEKFSLFFCLSLLVGAFIASVAAAYGGRERDENETLLLTR
jgi:hypothetical protein